MTHKSLPGITTRREHTNTTTHRLARDVSVVLVEYKNDSNMMEILVPQHTQMVCVGGVFVCVFSCAFLCVGVRVFSISCPHQVLSSVVKKRGGESKQKRNQRLPRTNLKINNFDHLWKYGDPHVSYHPKTGGYFLLL